MYRTWDLQLYGCEADTGVAGYIDGDAADGNTILHGDAVKLGVMRRLDGLDDSTADERSPKTEHGIDYGGNVLDTTQPNSVVRHSLHAQLLA